MTRAQDIALIDPIHPYAVHFVELARQRGLGTVCLWTNPKNRAGAWRFPSLRSEAVSAHYDIVLSDAGLRRTAELLARKHDVAAVIPHAEPAVSPSVTLAHLLGLSWAQAHVLPLFRDKYALKKALAGAPNGPRVNRIALVSTVREVGAAMDALDLDDIVLKPNDGYANVGVGFFDRTSTDAAIAGHLQQHRTPMLLEERLAGTEYFVNGLVNAAGNVDVTGVGVYVRAPVNGKPNIEIGDRTVRTSEPEFEVLATYARHVLEVSGVRRTPFHMECILDARGPCLVEVAARLIGGHVFDPSLPGIDLVQAALVQYLGDGSDERPPLDWRRYDEQVLGEVSGVSSRSGRIARVHGLAQAESTPGFVRWGHRPRVGDKVVPTLDRLSNPWTAVLSAPDVASWHQRGQRLRSTIELDVVAPEDHTPLLLARALSPVAGRLLKRGWAFATIR